MAKYTEDDLKVELETKEYEYGFYTELESETFPIGLNEDIVRAISQKKGEPHAIGHISGCHLNPAVSVGLWAGGRFPANQLLPYIVAQVVGAVVAGGVLYIIASGKAGFDVSAGFAANGYGAHSPGGYSLLAALVSEIVMTMMFLLVILGATDKRAPQGMAPVAIGFCLTLIHLISIPVTNTSVNPARSTGVAVFVGDWALAQLWLFWLAPIVGAILGAVIYRFIGSAED